MKSFCRARFFCALAAGLGVAVAPSVASPAGASAGTTTPTVTLNAPGRDAPGAAVPVVVTLSGATAGGSVVFTVPQGYCTDATWRHGASNVSGTCYVPLPRTSWSGKLSATATLSVGDVTQTFTGVTSRSVRTVGAPSSMPSPQEIAQISTCGNTSDAVWLTFDDRFPSSSTARKMIEVLNRNNAKGRFFLNTISSAQRRDLEGAGHLVFNHTRDHVALNELSNSRFRSQVRGGPPVTPGNPWLLRPPYGVASFSSRAVAQAKASKYRLCQWTTDTSDWKSLSAAQMYTKVHDGDAETPPVAKGGVILMHANHFSAAKVQAVIDAVRARGLTVEKRR